METEKRWNKCIILISILIVAGGLYLLSPVLTPFLVGVLLAYLVDPLVTKLDELHLPRLLSVIIVFLGLFLGLGIIITLLVPLIEKQFVTLTVVIPNIISWIQKSILPWLLSHFGIDEVIDVNDLKATIAENWMKAGGSLSWLWKTAMSSGLRILEWGVRLLLIPVVTFYLLRDWSKVLNSIHELLPRRIEPTVVRLVKECDQVLSGFFRGQLLVMLSLGVFYSIGLTLIGLPIGLLIGLIVGLLAIIPYLGATVGILTASIATYVQLGDFSHVLMVWALFAVGQSTESMFLTPKLVGGRIGLHPVAVIFSVLTGGYLFGFFGVLLALPVAAVIMVWMRFLHQQYRESYLYR
ncbi:hypothetical protein AYO45_00840 [Gammaproteobacteria bacterium SCGC AG-212-F23]|nr:hypothetical protein AYO45_00840 [Gammaproteobacteria bacterium SCGC AG-212-F23]